MITVLTIKEFNKLDFKDLNLTDKSKIWTIVNPKTGESWIEIR